MQITFTDDDVASTAARILEQYGYRSMVSGVTVETDCPALLAVPVVQRTLGFERVDDIQFVRRASPPRQAPAAA
jgi:hypothetical protein